MTIKIKLRGNGKALIKYDNPVEENYLIWMLLLHRDDKENHPRISVKKQNKELKPMPRRQEDIKPVMIKDVKPVSEG